MDSIGQGRVWSGTDALEIGLIDELGSLYQAIDYAAGLGGVKAIVVKEYPRYKLRGLEMIAALLDNMENEGGSLSISAGIKGFESITSELVRIKDLAGMKGVQARMMWHYSFE